MKNANGLQTKKVTDKKMFGLSCTCLLFSLILGASLFGDLIDNSLLFLIAVVLAILLFVASLNMCAISIAMRFQKKVFKNYIVSILFFGITVLCISLGSSHGFTDYMGYELVIFYFAGFCVGGIGSAIHLFATMIVNTVKSHEEMQASTITSIIMSSCALFSVCLLPVDNFITEIKSAYISCCDGMGGSILQIVLAFIATSSAVISFFFAKKYSIIRPSWCNFASIYVITIFIVKFFNLPYELNLTDSSVFYGGPIVAVGLLILATPLIFQYSYYFPSKLTKN